MSLDRDFPPLRDKFYDWVTLVAVKFAGFFGYPESPGMEVGGNITAQEMVYRSGLAAHKLSKPYGQEPSTLFEVVFGSRPKTDPIPRYLYTSSDEGFYNFYVQHYRNAFFLPDRISRFFQLKFNLGEDLSSLEYAREFLFLLFVLYAQIIIIRIALSWFIKINPYKVPWCYILVVTDWLEDAVQGIFPSAFSINFISTLYVGFLGFMADLMNHIVFTMPYLPSEGERMTLNVNGQLRSILVFHNMPKLWLQYPIPNYLREFWYTERPDILEYMQKTYSDSNVNFLPDQIFLEYQQHKEVIDSLIDSFFISNHFVLFP